MNLISLGKIDKKFLRYTLIYIIIMISLNVVSHFLEEGKALPENILLILIISHGTLIFFIIFEIRLRKTISKENTIIEKPNEKNESKKIIKYIFNDKVKEKFDIKKFFNFIINDNFRINI